MSSILSISFLSVYSLSIVYSLYTVYTLYYSLVYLPSRTILRLSLIHSPSTT